jgi:hypothetical protein
MVTKTSTTATDTRSVAELEAAVLAGDATVSAEMLNAARVKEHHAALLHEARLRQEHAAAAAVRDGEIEKLRADMLALADETDATVQAGVAAVAAVEKVLSGAKNRGRRLDELAARARALGITSMGLDDGLRDASQIGWRKDYSTVGAARIRIGDVLLGAAEPRKLVSRVVRDALVAAGERPEGFSLANPGLSLEEQASAQVRTITPPKLRRLRVAKRWGQHQVGDVVEVDGETAKWALQREFGEPV